MEHVKGGSSCVSRESVEASEVLASGARGLWCAAGAGGCGRAGGRAAGDLRALECWSCCVAKEEGRLCSAGADGAAKRLAERATDGASTRPAEEGAWPAKAGRMGSGHEAMSS